MARGTKRTAAREGQREVLAECVRAALRPVVRFCIRRSVKLQEVVEILKAVFVDLSLEELEEQEIAPSTSRLSIMSGVHRKDVDRLRSGEPRKPSAVDLLTRLIGQWQYDRRFCSDRGRPRGLSFEGMESEFSDLVSSVSRELNPYTVLFELERVGLVERQGSKLVLRREEYVAGEDLSQAFEMLGDDLDDLFRAVEGNVFSSEETPNLHLTTRYDNIAVGELPAIRRWFMREGERLHRRARQFLSRFDVDINPRRKGERGGGRVVLGSFSLAELPPADSEKDEESR